jgi:hypothetical protein
MRRFIFSLCLVAVFGLSTITAHANFSGAYELSNWQFSTGGDGSVIDNTPDSITLLGSNVPGLGMNSTKLTITIHSPVFVSFNWAFSSDSGSYKPNNAQFVFPNNNITLSNTDGQSGSYADIIGPSQDRDWFGWYITAYDNGAGRGALTITNFSVSPVPLPGAILFLGTGLASLGLLRRKSVH